MPTVENTKHIFSCLKKFQGMESLRQLFWEDLNYNRENTPIDNLPESAVSLVAEDPLCFATGGRDNDFHIIYIQLKTEKLLKTHERQIIVHLQTRYPDALYVFSNFAQKRWHFINVKLVREKEEKTEQQRAKPLAQRNLFRRITIASDERLRTAAERIAMLDLEEIDERDTLWDSSELLTALEIRKQHEEAFNVEAVTEAFFEDYKRVFRELQNELEEQADAPKWAHDYAQQFLTRCIFLYFIQRKGWLEGNTDFLNTFWQAYQDSQQPTNTFVEKWLNVLFFEAFNNRFHGGYAYFPRHIRNTLQLAPYLNGGLFRENELDVEYSVKVSDLLWQQIFTFLEQYNFTIAEDTPLDQEVAVDPEMIGRVYESLVSVEDEEKGDAGIFYTQRVEIDLMCRLALVDNLANHVGTESDKYLFYEVLFAFEPEEKMEADAKLADLWEAIYQHITEITVVDPACGSGSFLVGMLYVLDDLRERAEKYLSINSKSSFERRKEIIGKNLYGVDVKQWACKVAELRLWLALIIDADFDKAELTVRKLNEPLLPDFSFNIRHGDSIVQDVGGLNLAQTRGISSISSGLKSKVENLQTEKLRFYNNDPERKYAEKGDLQEAENSLFRELLQDYDVQVIKEIQKRKALLEDPAEQLTLTGLKLAESQQLNFETFKMQKELERLEENHVQLQRAREALSSNTTPPFVWDIAFVDIFSQRDGFDIVVENPPYTRPKDIRNLMLPSEEAKTSDNKDIYKEKLKRSVYQAFPEYFGYKENRDTVQRKLDGNSGLYIYFYFHGLSLLNPKGSFCSITPNSWLDVKYGKNLQEFFLKQCHLKMVLDNSAKRSFATADVNTVICLISAPNKNQESCLQHTVRFVNFTVPFEAILDAVIFYEIETASARDNSPEHRIHPLPQKSLLANGNDENAKYIGDKWGGKYLRAPDIYWTILEKGKDKLIRLGDVADVRRGCTTGANDFFYLDAEDIQKWGIESEYLKPVIKSPSECKNILVDPSQLQFKLFMCHADREALADTAALEYIKCGEKQEYHQRPSCRGRAPWWDLGKWDYADLLWIETMHESFKVHRNAPLIYESDKFYGIKSQDNINTLTALLNSTFMMFFKLLSGFHSLGGGALKTAVYEVKDFRVIKPELLTFNADLVEVLVQREIGTIQEDIEESNRRDIDAIIFDVLNLTTGERDGVYEAVIQLVTDRVEKAKNK